MDAKLSTAVAVLIGTLAIAGAVYFASRIQKPEGGEPIGRYQAVASNNDRHEIYVLDTQTGDIWACSGQPNLTLTVGCGVPRGRPH